MTKAKKAECKHARLYRGLFGIVRCGVATCEKPYYIYRCPGTHVQMLSGVWMVPSFGRGSGVYELLYSECPARHWYDHEDGRLYRLADKPSKALADADARAA